MKVIDPYNFTGKTKRVDTHILREIQLIYGIDGGWIERTDNLFLKKSAVVLDGAMVYDNACVLDDSVVYGKYTTVLDNARICEDAKVFGGSRIYGNASVTGNALVCGHSNIFANAIVTWTAKISNYARIGKDAFIEDTNDYLVVGPIGSRYELTTFYKGISSIMVCCGCFNDTIEKFHKRVKEVYGESKFAKQYRTAILCANKILA